MSMVITLVERAGLTTGFSEMRTTLRLSCQKAYYISCQMFNNVLMRSNSKISNEIREPNNEERLSKRYK
jgi:hypothetical protein